MRKILGLIYVAFAAGYSRKQMLQRQTAQDTELATDQEIPDKTSLESGTTDDLSPKQTMGVQVGLTSLLSRTDERGRSRHPAGSLKGRGNIKAKTKIEETYTAAKGKRKGEEDGAPQKKDKNEGADAAAKGKKKGVKDVTPEKKDKNEGADTAAKGKKKGVKDVTPEKKDENEGADVAVKDKKKGEEVATVATAKTKDENRGADSNGNSQSNDGIAAAGGRIEAVTSRATTEPVNEDVAANGLAQAEGKEKANPTAKTIYEEEKAINEEGANSPAKTKGDQQTAANADSKDGAKSNAVEERIDDARANSNADQRNSGVETNGRTDPPKESGETKSHREPMVEDGHKNTMSNTRNPWHKKVTTAKTFSERGVKNTIAKIGRTGHRETYRATEPRSSLLERGSDAHYIHESNCATFESSRCQKETDCIYVHEESRCESKCGKGIERRICRARGCFHHPTDGCQFQPPPCATLLSDECQNSQRCNLGDGPKDDGKTQNGTSPSRVKQVKQAVVGWFSNSVSACTEKKCEEANSRLALCQNLPHCKWDGAGQVGKCLDAARPCELNLAQEACSDRNCHWDGACVTKECKHFIGDKGGCEAALCAWVEGTCVDAGAPREGQDARALAAKGRAESRVVILLFICIAGASLGFISMYVYMRRRNRQRGYVPDAPPVEQADVPEEEQPGTYY